jgi:hypothetical protein
MPELLLKTLEIRVCRRLALLKRPVLGSTNQAAHIKTEVEYLLSYRVLST